MQLARFLNRLIKKDGFILIDAYSNKYIIGSPIIKSATINLENGKNSNGLMAISNELIWNSV